jgi:hypothetical protein
MGLVCVLSVVYEPSLLEVAEITHHCLWTVVQES